MKRSGFLAACFVLAVLTLFSIHHPAKANNTYHALTPLTPFAQDWSNFALLNAADDWSALPSINGYSDNVTDNVGADPQLQLIPSTIIDLSPNQNNPNLFSTGGVAEFDRGTVTDFVVALQGSGTHDFPNIDIRLDTSGCTAPSGVRVAYNVRDIDGSIDNTVQRVALHYGVGNSGNYTNVPSAYVADATTGPSLATLVTPIAVFLPLETRAQPEVHVRVMTSNAPGNDEWVGIDDINITCQAATAADASIAGRVMTPEGQGIAGVRVVVTGGSMPSARTVLTNAFGHYRLDGLHAGETYVVNVAGKRHAFAEPVRTVFLGQDALDVNFVGVP